MFKILVFVFVLFMILTLAAGLEVATQLDTVLGSVPY